MKKFSRGDRVQAIIPDPYDPDHQYHEEPGIIIDLYEDVLGGLTGNQYHNYLYTVDFDDDDLGVADFRYDDLEPL